MKNDFANGETETVNTTQEIFDSFNSFIFSSDTKVLGKLVARTNLFNKIIDVPGDIVECGVFKGSGMFTWLKLKEILAPNSFKKVIGFDFFDTDSLLAGLSGVDKERMADLFTSRNFKLDTNYKEILEAMIADAGFSPGSYEVIQGDISKTSYDIVSRRPGLKISLLYMDLDLEEPTYDALCAFWPRVSKGGIIVLDEYAHHQWSETLGVDRFAEENNLEIRTLDFNAPTAYITKL